MSCLPSWDVLGKVKLLPVSWYLTALSVSSCLFNPGWLMVMRLIGIYKYLNYKIFSIFNVAWQDLFMGMNVWKYLQSTVMRFKIKTWVKMQIECLKPNNIPLMGLGCLFPIQNVLATKSIIYNDRFWHMSERNIQYLESGKNNHTKMRILVKQKRNFVNLFNNPTLDVSVY